MPWGKGQIDKQALRSAPEDYAAFEAIGLAFKEHVRVLDVGCFDGFNTVLKFAPYSGIERVVGIDPDAGAIEEAAQRTSDARFEFHHTDFESFDPGDDRFDVVYFSHVFQHLPNQQEVMNKVARLLAPGGFVIVKTTDDGAKLSYPDPENVMGRLFALYDQYVRPNTGHTRVTDRYNGRKCLAYMAHAGLGDVRVRTFTTDTAGKNPEERRALYERCVYFRRNVPSCVDAETTQEIKMLVKQWGELFDRDDYYYCNVTFVAIGRKVPEEDDGFAYEGPVFGDRETTENPFVQAAAAARTADGTAEGRPAFRIRAMREADIGPVMSIQLESFSDPWTPLAFALELRHNPRAHYAVAVDAQGTVVGYVGWWETPECASISQIATAAQHRRQGIAHQLLAYALASAAQAACPLMQLEVRANNDAARAFYRAEGFEEVEVRPGYYEAPVDDAIVLARPC